MTQVPVINGWTVYAHPLFLDQFEKQQEQVKQARAKDPTRYREKRSTKVFAALFKTSFEVIPADPTRQEFRQGNTLGPAHRHWFRVKFLQQYRLFFRYRDTPDNKIIILCWVNDDDTLRAYGKSSDAYVVFARMLGSGNPPDDWDQLLAQATSSTARDRLTAATRRDPGRSDPD